MKLKHTLAAALAALFLLIAPPAQATETQAQINANILRILQTEAHVSSNDVKYLKKHITLMKLYDTASHLLADVPDEGSLGYALDTHVLYYKNNSAWVSFSAPTFGGAVTITGDLSLGGAAGALTFTAAASSIVTTDNSATGLVAGATGALAILTLDTRDAAEGVIIAGYESVSGLSSLTGGLVTGSTIDTGTGQTLTSATSGYTYVSNASTDAVTTFVLPAASTKSTYCFAFGPASLGSNRELDIATPAGSDLIVGTTTAAGSAGIATTAGASHGIKNTHATAVRGNGVCLRADGTNTWYMFGISGTFAAF